MAKVQVPAEERPNKTLYREFRGVHLTDPYLCGRSHSPYALNLMSNNEGLPELRPGWRVLHTLPGNIHALGCGRIGEKEVRLLHAKDTLYQWNDEGFWGIYEGLSDTDSNIFFAVHENKTKAFVLTGSQYLVYDGVNVRPVEEIATVPLVLIAKKPGGGGTPYQAVNLLTPKRIEGFAGDGTSKIFQLAAYGSDVQWSSSRSGGWSSTGITAGGSWVTFATAPPTPSVAGEDNVFIRYSASVAGYADRIKKCRLCTEYSENGAGRIFTTRNPNFRNYDWWSEMNDPTYFPDLNYSVVGSANTAIMGYCKIAKHLAVIKEDNAQDTTIFLRYPAAKSDGGLYFRMEAGVSGTGAVAPGSFVSLIDEPLFLSRTGVYAVTSNNVTAERTLQNRSYFVDEGLSKEKDLEKAVATQWRGYYLLAVNGNVYAMNARAKELRGMGLSYNCFLWDNIPARLFLTLEDALYFADDKGNLCRFNTDLEGTAAYHDNGAAITVYWATCLDHDGLPQQLKTMQKKGSGITTKPFARSIYEVAVVTERGEAARPLKTFYRDIFDLENVDLDRFSLESSPYAKFTPFQKKVKKYQALQVVVRAKALREGFGIYNIVKQWLPVNYVKR